MAKKKLKKEVKKRIALIITIIILISITISIVIIHRNNPEMAGIILGLVVSIPLVYTLLSIRFVKPDERGEIYLLDKFWKKAPSGIRVVPFLVAYLVKFFTGIQRANLVPEEVMIAATKTKKRDYGEESQPVTVDVMQPFFFFNIKKIFRGLGARNVKIAMGILFGKKTIYKTTNERGEEIEEEGWKGGFAGGQVAALIRQYVASNKIKTLDDAYKMREKLAELIFETLKKELPLSQFGIKWMRTVVRDVKARPEIEDARTDKAKEAISRDKAKITAQTTVIGAEAEAEATRKKGVAQADVDFAKLNAKLEIIDKSGKVSLDGAGKILTILLYGTEIADSLKDMGELKLFMAPNLQGILESAFGGSTTVAPKKLLEMFASLSDPEKATLKTELSKLMGGK